MELAALYDLKLGERMLLSFYAAPIGDPALGPTAYPHRASAAENPVGTLGHHQEDSTHIASDVATVGLTHGMVRVEASGFHGREPDEFRWNIDQGTMDSWSTRMTVQPGQDWSGQYSYGRLKSPEALLPLEDQERMTASVMYDHPLTKGNWVSTALWGRARLATTVRRIAICWSPRCVLRYETGCGRDWRTPAGRMSCSTGRIRCPRDFTRHR